MVWRGKGRRKAARALKGAGGGPGGESAGSPAPKPKGKRSTPLPSRRSSKRGGAGERGGRGGGDEDDRRERVPRPTTSPAPFIIAGGFVLAAIFIVVIVASGRKDSRGSGGGSYASGSGDGSSSAPASGGGSSGGGAVVRGRPLRRGGSAHVEIRFVHQGLSRTGDGRYMTAACGRCGTQFTSRVDTCPNASCGAQLRWKLQDRKKCEFCCPRDKLKVEDLDQIPEDDRDGFCAFCGGSGKDPKFQAGVQRGLFGLDKTQPGGGGGPSGTGGCPICKGSSKCMKCVGSGWITVPDTFGQ